MDQCAARTRAFCCGCHHDYHHGHVLDANPRVEEEILHAIGRDDVDPLKTDSLVDNLRDEIVHALAVPRETIDQNRVNTEFYDTNVTAHLLFAWLAKANNPGLPICRWLWEGAPAGLTADFSCLDGLFPRVDAEGKAMGWNEEADLAAPGDCRRAGTRGGPLAAGLAAGEYTGRGGAAGGSAPMTAAGHGRR